MKRKAKQKSRGPGLLIGLASAALMALFFGWMWAQANVVHVMRATVYLADLPAAFEGRTILYASDIDLGGTTTVGKTAEFFRQLESLQPDMLILGGDYSTHTLLQTLNGETLIDSADLQRRSEFLHYMKNFPAPLGRFLLAAEQDGEMFAPEGFELLNDSKHAIGLDGETLWLVGVTENSEGIRRGGKSFRSGECVIAVADTPACFPTLNTTEAKDGGRWVDLCLAGHTHGGQIRLRDRTLLRLNSLEQHFLYGWIHETGVPMLTTSGLGCEGVNLRLGTQAEVWLITLSGDAGGGE